MEDQAILQLYFDRSEAAIVQTDAKYGAYCYSIAYHILSNREDSEESVSDTYFAAWNAIPPRKPSVFATFLGRITRNISINRWNARTAVKRGGGEMALALEELSECIAGGTEVEETFQNLLAEQLAWSSQKRIAIELIQAELGGGSLSGSRIWGKREMGAGADADPAFLPGGQSRPRPP